ncbi:50S ribosomal protein L35, chloroplastic [Lolium rigidum]|uniref:50S ribosomal protein L35, chloroplastic n=1 Tax=Lolium rigidum TaxID=89674 RepID=UPI001F5D2BC5|nr:50S ribosomal protein L35, chloroplastic [Lolium rigidum]
MAMSLSLARLALPLQSLPAAAGKRPANATISFTANSFFGAPLAVAAATATALSPAAPLARSLSVVAKAGKGYKMKTHKASAKRFRVTGTGKIVRRCAGKQHLLSKKNAKRRKRLSKMVQVNKSDYSNVMGALPYLKVNKKAGGEY